jgi:ParB-like chromosome segregation protein Spo0J
MDKVQINEPIILAEILPGRFNLIDGNHRIVKAHRLGIERIHAYRLNIDQHIKFLTSMEGYKAYVEYWNSKY